MRVKLSAQCESRIDGTTSRNLTWVQWSKKRLKENRYNEFKERETTFRIQH